jgi:Putative peptidoglycan binding domain
MKTQKSVRTDSSRRLLLMVPVICPKSVSLSILTALAALVVAPGLMGQTTAHFAHASAGPVQMSRFLLTLPAQPRAGSSNIRIAGFPDGPTQLPHPLVATPANDAWARDNAWAAYDANLRHIPTAENPNRLAASQNLLDQGRFIQMPQSTGRYNFQFSDHEIRSVQAALRRLGVYSGQVDGILGPDTQRAVEDYQVENKLPVTGQPDQRLNALLGIF